MEVLLDNSYSDKKKVIYRVLKIHNQNMALMKILVFDPVGFQQLA